MKDAYEEYDYYFYVKDGKTHTTALVSEVSLVTESGTDTYSYTYDNLGNILTVSKNGTLVESYEYDSLNQLTRENNSLAGYTKLYTYDPMGNITSKVELPFTLSATDTLDTSSGTVTSYGYGEGFGTGMYVWHDVLTSYSGTTITYDNIGNPLNWRNASELNWSARELVSAKLSNDDTLAYTYNADGIRTQKVYNGTTHNYVLDGTKIIKEEVSVDGNTSYELYYIYDASGSVIGLQYNNVPYYFLKNLQGDVVSIINAAGTVVVEYTYDAWGKALTTTGTLASTVGTYNPFRYRGYYYDSETGFYYLQSRYYDPIVGRFLNADAYVCNGQGLLGYNMFAYCGNNPIIRSDPTGRFPLLAALAVIAVVSLVAFTSCGDQSESLEDTIADSAPKTTAYDTKKEAVDAGIVTVVNKYNAEREKGIDREQGIIVYEYDDKYYLTQVLSGDDVSSVDCNPDIVRDGDICADIHTHPWMENDNPFSPQDFTSMKELGYESYVVIVGDDADSGNAYYLPYEAWSYVAYERYYYDE